MRPRTEQEKQIFETWKQIMPVEAFSAGVNDCAGRVFVPSRVNRDKALKEVDRLKASADGESQRKLLSCLSTYVEIFEPEQIPGTITDAFFAHMVKEGIRPAHLSMLADYSSSALRDPLPDLRGQTHPMGIRLLTQMRCDSLHGILAIVKKSTKSKALRSKIQSLSSTLNGFAAHFAVPGFKNQGFDEVYALIQAKGCDLGRSQIYAQALRDLYDYRESPLEVEEKGLRFLKNEQGDFNRAVSELSSKFGAEPKAEALTQSIHKEKSLHTKKIIGFLKDLRKRTVRVINSNIVGVNPGYKTRVIETPKYLSSTIPSGAAFFMDYLAAKPFQLFLTTTDPRRSPHTVPAELLNLLVHEEYGHCVHASNSAVGFGAKPIFVEMLSTHLGSAVSEGLSFQREYEFLEYLARLEDQSELRGENKAFVSFWNRYDGSRELKAEYEFFTKMWRIVRFLRVIGDARINSGKQELAAFIDWANNETGLSKSLVYHQLFPAHQGIGPGYASTYALVGESIREIQKPLTVGSEKFVRFNTYASSMGFPPRTLFEERLRSMVT